MSHHHHGRPHHGHHGASGSYDSNYGAQGYQFNPLQQGGAHPPQQAITAYPPQAQYSGAAYDSYNGGSPYGQVQPYDRASPYGAGYGAQQQVTPYQTGGYGGYQGPAYLQAEEQRHKKNEHRAEMGAVGAVAFAAWEKHEEKVDPAHAHRHHVEAQVAEAAALGLGGYALHEHHEASKLHKQQNYHGGGHHKHRLG